ncbi:MAG: RICIN domain-containing protein [Chitinispirillales bacterium]|jgi:ribosomal protein S6E (S10)|nr:RICIN domain-containing protein [Chitinispirillales bacterium]
MDFLKDAVSNAGAGQNSASGAMDAVKASMNEAKANLGDKFSGTYVITNVNGLALEVKGGSQINNIPIITWRMDSGDSQRFTIEWLPDSACYKITAKHSKKVLTIVGDRVVQSAWTGTDGQKWVIVEENGIIQFTSKLNGKALDVPGNSRKEGTEMWVYPVNKTPAQQFKLTRSS